MTVPAKTEHKEQKTERKDWKKSTLEDHKRICSLTVRRA